jgi:molybdopterin adenylyltransferase
MAYHDHQALSAPIVARCAVVTLSDTRTEEMDKSGRRIRELLDGAGHATVAYRLLKDDPATL